MTTSMMTNIKFCIDKEFENYIMRVAERFNLDRDELYKMRTNEDVSFARVEGAAVCQPVATSSAVVTQPVQYTSVTNGCQYVLLRGAQKGSKCGKKVGKNGGDFCCRHAKSVPETKNRKTQAIPEPIDVLKQSKVLRKNKSFDKLWHEESGMVFASAVDRTVVQRCVNGSLQDLSNEDIDLCKELGFAYRKNDKKSFNEDSKLPCDMDIQKSMDEEEVSTPMDEEEVSKPMEEEVSKPMDEQEVSKPMDEEEDTAENIHSLLNGLRINEDEILEEEY